MPSQEDGSSGGARRGPGTLGREVLIELALDLHWAWNHRADELWALLDAELWAATHNPWVVVQTASPEALDHFVSRPEIRERLRALLEQRRQHLVPTTWFDKTHSTSGLGGVAYLSMEFALSEALPIYSGGLGNVAGDQLKAACDLGVPVVGVGLLYQQGYFRQVIRPDGSQIALYPYNDPGQLPITLLRDASGASVQVELSFLGFPIRLRVWQVRVDRRVLYLLDSNDVANPPAARAITSELYGGGPELRLLQEIVLGIGGWRLLRALHLTPDVCHLNEGHAALAVLERARCFSEDNQCPFDVAVMATRAGNVFTTHTAVPAGFDRFAPQIVERYLRRYVEDELGITMHDFLALGRANPNDPSEDFNMAFLAVRSSSAVNGVSRLHGAVSRQLFGTLFHRWPESEVPIGHVTNGIHVPTWDSAAADALWTKACGGNAWRGDMTAVSTGARNMTDADLWRLRSANRKELVDYVRERMPRELASSGASVEEVARARQLLDPQALTLGFARRFATYKRSTLLLHSPERLLRILADQERPAQLVIAGKAHPADAAGQEMISEWMRFTRRPEVQGRVIFIPDYDLLLAERLVQGVDLWINTPRRPWEASGTSGMKVLVNGGLNLSELDGWWAEAYTPDVGWALGDGREHGDNAAWDAEEAEALYSLLEREIVPEFYTRAESGIPTKWVARIRESMAKLTPLYSTNRAVREYTEHYYLPAASLFHERTANGAAQATRLVAWRRNLAEHWHEARFGALHVESRENQHEFTIEVGLGGLDPDSIRVELFADSTQGAEPSGLLMTRSRAPGTPQLEYTYGATVSALRPATDYTPRLVAHHPDARTPIEAPFILWQR